MEAPTFGRNPIRKWLLRVLLALWAAGFVAYSAPVWDENFNIPAVNGTVYAIAETADAFFYGGSFTSVGTVPANNIVRVDKATGATSALGTAALNGTNGTVRALAVIGSDLFVGGSFYGVSSATQGGVLAGNIAKWDPIAGSWALLGSSGYNGVNDTVNALAVMGTDLYVGGKFVIASSATQGSVSAKRVAKWATASGTWSPLGSLAQNGLDSEVYALGASGNRLFVGGYFHFANSATQASFPAEKISVWDVGASQWTSVGSVGRGVHLVGNVWIVDDVTTIVVQGTDVYVGGNFDVVFPPVSGGVSASNVARWDTVTRVWHSLDDQNGSGLTYSVTTLAVNEDSVFVGGLFDTVVAGNQSPLHVNRVARWDLAAGTWSALGAAPLDGVNAGVNALTISGTNLHVGGAFSAAGGTEGTRGLAKWNRANDAWEPAMMPFAGDGIVGSVRVILDAGPVVYVGGAFTSAGNIPGNNIACWNKATRTWAVLGTPSQNGVNAQVNALAMCAGELFVGGQFTKVSSGSQNAITANYIAKWDAVGNVWSPLGNEAANGTGDAVSALAVRGSVLYVGGLFASVLNGAPQPISANRIAKWDIIGSTWSALGSGTQNGVTGSWVAALAVNGADLYVAGMFSSAGSSSQSSVAARNIAKWDTTTETWSPLGTPAQNGTSGLVNTVAVAGTKLFVGGLFTSVSSDMQNAISANKIAAWDIPGARWFPCGTPMLNGTNSSVYGLAVDGFDVYAAGSFFTASSSTQNAIPAYRLAKWNTALEKWFPFGGATQNGADERVFTVALSGSSLYAGGDFGIVNSTTQPAVPSNRFGMYGPLPPPPAGATMMLAPSSPLDASAALAITFSDWTSANGPLLYTVFVDDVEASPSGSGASRNFTGPAAPGAHTVKGRIADSPGNVAEVTQSFTVLTAQESWREFYFGTTANAGDAADSADPDGDGFDNLFEFVAGLVPNDPASRFAVRAADVPEQPGQKAIVFGPVVAGRTYAVMTSPSLSDPAWALLASSSTSENGTERTVTDLAAGAGPRFYRVEITKP